MVTASTIWFITVSWCLFLIFSWTSSLLKTDAKIILLLSVLWHKCDNPRKICWHYTGDPTSNAHEYRARESPYRCPNTYQFRYLLVEPHGTRAHTAYPVKREKIGPLKSTVTTYICALISKWIESVQQNCLGFEKKKGKQPCGHPSIVHVQNTNSQQTWE